MTTGNGVDLAYEIASTPGPTDGRHNCFIGNTFATANPPDIETVLSCAAGAATPKTINISPRRALPSPTGVDYRTMPVPPPQPDMPDARTAPARPAVGPPPAVDPATITVPKG